jgi:hypothetical protein
VKLKLADVEKLNAMLEDRYYLLRDWTENLFRLCGVDESLPWDNKIQQVEEMQIDNMLLQLVEWELINLDNGQAIWAEL